MTDLCKKCGKEAILKVEPNRHATSPNSINYRKNGNENTMTIIAERNVKNLIKLKTMHTGLY